MQELQQRFYPKMKSGVDDKDTFPMKSISPQDVPSAVMEEIEDRANTMAAAIPASAKFSRPFLVEHSDGSQTYIIHLAGSKKQRHEFVEMVFFIDTIQGEYAGIGEIWFSENPREPDSIRGVPFVGNTDTEIETEKGEKLLRRGMAERCYMLMNALSREEYGTALHAGYLNEMSKPIWDKLVMRGVAVKVSNDPDESQPGKYRFVI